ncbi:hypothetical protein J7K07_04835 [Candidatus Bathyarchaeota archaeon]|nr:hypothetical protein [Candidatus Bathyarchaeota archaeon]
MGRWLNISANPLHKASKAIFCLLLTFFLFHPAILNVCSKYTVYVYGFSESPSTELILRRLSQLGYGTIFLDLNGSSRDKFLEIVEMIRLLGVEVIPPEQCIQCMLLHYNWSDILVAYASPLACFFQDGRLKAITVGVTDPKILTEASNFRGEYVKVFSLNGEYIVSGEDARRLENLILEEKTFTNITSRIFSSIVLLALADSINPCTFTVFTALLLISLHSLGRMRAALTGISFVLAVFICYYSLGLGLIQALTGIPYADKVIAIAGLIIGAISIARGLKPEFKSPIPKTLRKPLEKFLEKAYFSPVASFILGALASFALLPCSGGPYIVGLGILSTLKEKFQAYLLLALYNTIFVAPLLIILLAVLASRRYVRKVKILRGRCLGTMEFISGLILIIICLLMLFSSIF